MSAAMILKAARDLVPGDILVFINCRAVVLRVSSATHQCRDKRIISYGRLSDGVACDEAFAPDSQFTVELPAGLTPVQARVDDLLKYAKWLHDEVPINLAERNELFALLDELDPPKPPTLEEALELLHEVAQLGDDKFLNTNGTLSRVDAFLKRVPN